MESFKGTAQFTKQDLRDWRAEMGFTQEEAAAELGYTRAWYGKLENLSAGAPQPPEHLRWACAAIYAGLRPWPHR